MRYTILGIMFFISLIFGTVWVVKGNNFFLSKIFNPAEEQVRRETFEESKAYNQGMIQELQNMQFQYYQVGENEKSIVLKDGEEIFFSTSEKFSFSDYMIMAAEFLDLQKNQNDILGEK